MSIPAELRYTAEHEWVALDGQAATVGITDYAADALGDVVYVQLPEVGAGVTAGQPCGEIESTKSVSDIYAPVTGLVTAVNDAIVDDPALVNSDAYGAGWLFKVEVTEELSGLLTGDEYAKLTETDD